MSNFEWNASSLTSLAFHSASPICVLTIDGCLMDWNLTFDELFAKPFHFLKGQRPSAIGIQLPSASQPHDDATIAEPQTYLQETTIDLPSIGNVRFQCILSQLIDPSGMAFAWTLTLNPIEADIESTIWSSMQQRLDREITWSKYAVVYDSLLLNFPAYRSLLRDVSEKVHGHRRCADLGTGTGNSAIQLLQDDSLRSVSAVDSNEFMLRCFSRKVGDRYAQRLHIQQDDIEKMPYFEDQMFDAVTMVNSLYAVNDPSLCLGEVHRILRPNGRLVLSNPHSKTNVDQLLAELRRSLLAQGLFEKFAHAFRVAEVRHAALSKEIHRLAVGQTLAIVESSGFEIESCTKTYVESVILLVAKRK